MRLRMNNSEKFENKVKAYLDESVEDLSPDITRRLQQARYAAIEKSQTRSIWSFYPHAATAVVAIAVISISINLSQKNMVESVLAMEDEIELLASNDNLELMEDLEFIQWLVESEEYAG